jgi:hypothetical protein
LGKASGEVSFHPEGKSGSAVGGDFGAQIHTRDVSLGVSLDLEPAALPGAAGMGDADSQNRSLAGGIDTDGDQEGAVQE